MSDDDANPKQAYGDNKVPLHLIPPSASAYIALGLGEGAIKYGPFNWRETRVEAMTYVGAALRHIADFVDRVDVDPDSIVDKPSIAGALASLSILADAIEGGFLIDNRPPAPVDKNVRQLMDEMQTKIEAAKAKLAEAETETEAERKAEIRSKHKRYRIDGCFNCDEAICDSCDGCTFDPPIVPGGLVQCPSCRGTKFLSPNTGSAKYPITCMNCNIDFGVIKEKE